MQSPNPAVLKRPKPQRALISLVPMIDVMLILLVFFMVTSTYLNLDMIPAVQRTDQNADASAPEAAPGSSLLIRIGADGVPTVRGQGLDPAALETLFRDRLNLDAALRVLVLPSGAADMQALVAVMDTATRAGATDLRVMRLEVQE